MTDAVKKKNLFQLGEEAQALDDLITEYAEEHEGDLSGIDDLIEKWSRETEASIESKVQSYAAVIRTNTAVADFHKTAEKRANALRKTSEGLVLSLKERLMSFMKSSNRDKIEWPGDKVWIQKSGGKRSMTIADDAPKPEGLADDYKITTVTYNNDALRKEAEKEEELVAAYRATITEEDMDNRPAEVEAKEKEFLATLKFQWVKLEPRGSSLRLK